MKAKFAITSMLTAGAVAIAATVTLQQPSQAQSTQFVCGMSSTTGLPTTFALTSKGPVPVVRWYAEYFSGSGYTPERRCQEVSSRFDNLSRQGQLGFITTGYVNGQPVVCAGQGGGCNSSNLLFTLKSGTDAAAAVQQLFDIRAGVGGPLYESSGDDGAITIDLNNFLDNAAVDPNGPSEGSASGTNVPTSEPSQPSGSGGSVW
ncbi:COP23 domain-containing protein [Laspinema sp. A4]|uniref:COP23 domain-containing protein n=1 Tax=Laspinema sp. D2d TaxID=2953686 RepID=UPI0021BBB4A2|nr:COP23 domain-containing protein [Laspinema sp. D2d]MCT7985516.1 COP23 domain-containing protein [Laspinema sp. D2d]